MHYLAFLQYHRSNHTHLSASPLLHQLPEAFFNRVFGLTLPHLNLPKTLNLSQGVALMTRQNTDFAVQREIDNMIKKMMLIYPNAALSNASVRGKSTHLPPPGASSRPFYSRVKAMHRRAESLGCRAAAEQKETSVTLPENYREAYLKEG